MAFEYPLIKSPNNHQKTWGWFQQSTGFVGKSVVLVGNWKDKRQTSISWDYLSRKKCSYHLSSPVTFCGELALWKHLNVIKKFDDGENGLADLDTALSRHPEKESKRVIVDFPIWMVASLDRETQRLGVTRQSIIKIWLAERLQQGH